MDLPMLLSGPVIRLNCGWKSNRFADLWEGDAIVREVNIKFLMRFFSQVADEQLVIGLHHLSKLLRIISHATAASSPSKLAMYLAESGLSASFIAFENS